MQVTGIGNDARQMVQIVVCTTNQWMGWIWNNSTRIIRMM
jgi:hypothetical protein